MVADMLGKVNVLQLRQRASYRASGVSWAEHKAITQDTHAIRMGADIDGLDGYVGVEVQIILRTINRSASMILRT